MKPRAFALKVRAARPADVPQLVQLSAPFVVRGSLRVRSGDEFAARIRDFAILEQGQRAMGCYGLRRVPGAGRSVSYLYNFCVDQWLHGCGVGGQLLADATRAARASGAAALYTATNRADLWFEDRGFALPAPDDDIAGGLSRLMDSSRGSRLLVIQFEDCVAPGAEMALRA